MDEGYIEGLLCEEDQEYQGTGDAMNDVEGKDNDNLTNSKENKGDEWKKDESNNNNDVIDVDGTDVKVCIALALRKIA